MRLGVIPPPLDSESASDDGVMIPGLSERELLLPDSEPFLLGRSLSISSRSFPGNDVAGALRTDLGVDGPLDVRVDSEASDADGARVALSAVGGRVGFLREERDGGGGRKMEGPFQRKPLPNLYFTWGGDEGWEKRRIERGWKESGLGEGRRG